MRLFAVLVFQWTLVEQKNATHPSELSVNISANMDGETVVCTRGTMMMIGNDSLRVAGKLSMINLLTPQPHLYLPLM